MDVVLWGRGTRAEQFYRLYNKNALRIVKIIDNNQQLVGTRWHDIETISYNEYKNYYNGILIIVSPDKHREIIRLLQNDKIMYCLLMDCGATFCSRNCSEILNKMKGRETEISFYQKELFDKIFLSGSLLKTDDIVKKYMLGNYRGYDVIVNYDCEAVTKPLEFLLKGEVKCKRDDFEWSGFRKGNDVLVLHGLVAGFIEVGLANRAYEADVDVLFEEDGFIRSIEPLAKENCKSRFAFSHSIIIDKGGLYIDGKVPSCIENILNSNYTLTITEKNRAQYLINYIIENHISKYNHQPDMMLHIGRENVKKILVIDQVPGDMSIEYGLAAESTFKEMLSQAKKDNSDADIIIKMHPAAAKSHFGQDDIGRNVYFIDYEINPIVLMNEIDEVYVCTSLLGFEALMCKKKVHVFGLPFYAGWGLTDDKIKCRRRTKTRSLEEVFYAAYVLATQYVSYKTKSGCEIEQALTEILELRDEYNGKKITSGNAL